ncbi:hypothetical protein LCGC14_0770990 [marine sediment metagenome]|uniref:Uncharacterized protein n=1 Tax=marine sediment metagenome TaxID=412755 RepID=A0A0F9SIE3_9ZZZZ
MKILISEITIGNFRFDYVTNFSIESSWDTFTDTASIVIPNKFRKDNKTIVVGGDNTFQRRDPVKIKIGYFPNLQTKFKGFLANIRPESPLVFECEDTMWLLKQENLVSKLFTRAKISDVIEYATASLPDLTIEYDNPDTEIGDFQVDNKGFVNAVTVFEVLKKQFGYFIYFENEILQVRRMRSVLALDNPIHKMSFQNNVIQDNLVYQRDDDVNLVIKVESIDLDTNTRIIRYGFKVKGETVVSVVQRTGQTTKSLNVLNLNAAQIEEFIKDNIDKYIYEGYIGDFTTFLEPSVEHSDRIEFTDLKHREREGRYLIKKVTTGFGINGGRQTIELQNRVL